MAKDKMLLKREFKANDIIQAIGENMTKRVKGRKAEVLERAGRYRIEVHFTRSMVTKKGTIAIAELYAPTAAEPPDA